ncbi:uncharacterized domain 1-containing protein [Paracoccus halophilus]|uniref:Medium/long-chain acyl-CoA thioesterase YigI n=1 Tax=Paracoccus halophilus TaxID=376733 RepID=A0A099F920_9RHOB|nr:PaaI family thioesterase [Paracoccus halophilus]KGJ06728.1 phenylacetic acid degradation protein [Paracoccus halophilus]SFA41956.1 uncharacterized domain 1-containing protein [Paracoccus halophilus]
MNDMEARIRASFDRQSMMRTLGATLTAVAPGQVTISAPILPGALQQHGAGHAGLTFSIGDSAAGYAALSLMPETAEVMTVEMKINLMSPALGESLIAEGRVIRPGRRILVVAADVWAVTGASRKHVAMLQGTMIPV